MSNWLMPYFFFNGNCEEAVRFYVKVLGGEATIMHLGDAPPNSAFPVPDDLKNLVMHAELRREGHVINFSDWCTPNVPYSTGNNISFALQFDTKEETKAMFDALSTGGTIELDLQETFFSPLYGKLNDKFGVMWQIVCNKASQKTQAVCPYCGAKFKMNIIEKLVLFVFISFAALYLLAIIGIRWSK